MSTRANIILKDSRDKLMFYRHSDGYPEGTLPTLKTFISWVKVGKIRNNVQQSAGWLILIGANEYKTTKPEGWAKEVDPTNKWKADYNIKIEPEDWKCGAYEPAVEMAGDIEYLYTVDLEALSISVEKVTTDWTTFDQTFNQVMFLAV